MQKRFNVGENTIRAGSGCIESDGDILVPAEKVKGAVVFKEKKNK